MESVAYRPQTQALIVRKNQAPRQPGHWLVHYNEFSASCKESGENPKSTVPHKNQ